MTDAAALWAACLDDPTDDTLRLVLADLLRESPDPDNQARGRFLWGGATAARWSHDHDVIDDPLYNTAQSELSAVATAGHPAHWLGLLGIGPDPLTRTDWQWDATHDRVTVRIGDTLGTYARGMLTGVSVTLGLWQSLARVALARWPVERVAFTDVPGLVLYVDRADGAWRLRLRGRRVPRPRTVVTRAASVSSVHADGPADWWTEERFPDRATLVARAADATAEMVTDLRREAGDQWPQPPRRR